MTEAEQVAELEKYMQQTRKALKVMSKNDLIRAVSALLLDKQMLMNQLNKLKPQTGVNNVTENSVPDPSAGAITNSESTSASQPESSSIAD